VHNGQDDGDEKLSDSEDLTCGDGNSNYDRGERSYTDLDGSKDGIARARGAVDTIEKSNLDINADLQSREDINDVLRATAVTTNQLGVRANSEVSSVNGDRLGTGKETQGGEKEEEREDAG